MIWHHRTRSQHVGALLKLHFLLAAVHVDFDEDSVGRGGAGFAWPQYSGLEEQPLHLPKHTLGSYTSESDEESAHDRDRDHAESVDHEVSRTALA